MAAFVTITTLSVATERISLAGQWRFAMGAPEPSFPPAALPAIEFADSILLPGTTETRGKGPENTARERGMLTRVHKFEGAAWYQRDVEIPASWTGQRIDLQLERTKYTQVWFDDALVGAQRIFTAPQNYDLTALVKPGHHRITVMVDNRVQRLPFTPNVHQFNSDNTQVNWNGLLGRIELIARPALWLDSVRVFPDVAQRRFRVEIIPGRLPRASTKGIVTILANSFNHPGKPQRVAPVSAPLIANADGGAVWIDVPLGADAKLWDEFSPALYKVLVTLQSPDGRDDREIEVGLREFKSHGTQFTINGRTTFLRGKHDGCVFPLTGHPPMDVAGWLAYFRTCQEYGINHIRCHTWTPPEAAFIAANRLGIYLQSELPFWGTFDAGVRDFLMPEAEAMLRAYGNNPSFVMLTLANEAGGDRAMMNAMVTHLRDLDSRHLYADGSNNVLWDPRPQATNDFWVTAKTRTPASGERQLPARGSFYVGDGYDGVVQWGPAQTRVDLAASTAGLSMPVIGHETGQYTVYPNFSEIAKYTGVTRAHNLERFRDTLARRGRLDQADAFFRASGALSASLYKEEIELALRTPGWGGFQLLDLQDYPGQGTALVGMLDAFMDSKGLITPERWREFCSPIVPLARFDRYTWTNADIYTADLQVAHYGAADLVDAVTTWQVADQAGGVLAHGELAAGTITQGALRNLGRVEVPLENAAAPARYNLTVTVTSAGHRYSNRWPLWVYPRQPDAKVASNVTVVRGYDERVRSLLADGKRVVLIPDENHRGSTVRGAYATDFWCWPMFSSSPGTMGLLCNVGHPALAEFPTASHSERQWSAIAHASAPIILADAPASFRPIVQVIDNLERNDLIGLIFEARVGPGSLLVVASDLYALKQAPEARQLLASLLAYAASPEFAPTQELSPDVLDRCLRPSLATRRSATASSSYTPPWGFVPKPESCVDGDINTRWQAAENDHAPWFAVDLERDCLVDTVELLWENDESGYRYLLETSPDGSSWSVLSDQRENHFEGGRHTFAVPVTRARHLRVTITGWPKDARAALRDFRVLGADQKPIL